jgi:predicted XRE-type DNA-binding protein
MNLLLSLHLSDNNISQNNLLMQEILAVFGINQPENKDIFYNRPV